MEPRSRPFKGLLRKRVDYRDAPPNGLAAQLGAPPNKQDVTQYVTKEFIARFMELDKHFALDSSAPNIWEHRAKALIELYWHVPASSQHWWQDVCWKIVRDRIPGFSTDLTKKQLGAPKEWSDEKRIELFSDVEFLKKTHKLSAQEIFNHLSRSKNYSQRWGRYKPPGLRKQYTEGKKCVYGSKLDFILARKATKIPADCVSRTAIAIEHFSLKHPLS
jgi:hypothetical protein